MASTTHVFLIHDDVPARAEAVAPFLRARLARKDVIRLPFRWLRRLAARVLAWSRARTLGPTVALLGGPSPRRADIAEQATALQITLGRRYVCHPVLHGGEPTAARA